MNRSRRWVLVVFGILIVAAIMYVSFYPRRPHELAKTPDVVVEFPNVLVTNAVDSAPVGDLSKTKPVEIRRNGTIRVQGSLSIPEPNGVRPAAVILQIVEGFGTARPIQYQSAIAEFNSDLSYVGYIEAPKIDGNFTLAIAIPSKVAALCDLSVK